MENQNKPQDKPQDLKGQTALVTGASRGIGKAIALELASKGAKVIGTATSSKGCELIKEFLSPYNDCHAYELNLSQDASIENLGEYIRKSHNSLQILINNAGMVKDNLMLRMKHEDFESIINVNLTANFKLIKLFARDMLKQNYGRIVNIGSVIGSIGNSGQVNYSAAKAGLSGMTKALARELASKNITVNCICPGFIETDMTGELSDNIKDELLKNIPLKRMGQAQDIASAAYFLVSPMANYITGIDLHVNGGLYMG